MNEKIEKLKEMILKSNNIVFFGGAGVSTESGIPDFRSKDGLYNEKYKYNPEVILSHDFWLENPEEFYKFYKDKLNCLKAEPNIVHYTLAKLEQMGQLRCIITQNIDGLHQKAGSKNIAELHGSMYRNTCIKCKKKFEAEFVFNSNGIPRCECGAVIKPDVVLYDEQLSLETTKKAVQAIEECDLLIVGGTSLAVYPASSYVRCFKGQNLVIINKEETSYDKEATLVINESLGTVFSEIMKLYE